MTFSNIYWPAKDAVKKTSLGAGAAKFIGGVEVCMLIEDLSSVSSPFETGMHAVAREGESQLEQSISRGAVPRCKGYFIRSCTVVIEG